MLKCQRDVTPNAHDLRIALHKTWGKPGIVYLMSIIVSIIHALGCIEWHSGAILLLKFIIFYKENSYQIYSFIPLIPTWLWLQQNFEKNKDLFKVFFWFWCATLKLCGLGPGCPDSQYVLEHRFHVSKISVYPPHLFISLWESSNALTADLYGTVIDALTSAAATASQVIDPSVCIDFQPLCWVWISINMFSLKLITFFHINIHYVDCSCIWRHVWWGFLTC